MDVAVVAGQVVVAGDAEVRGGQEALPLLEDRPLEAVTVDALHEVDVGGLLDPDPDPRAVREPVVEVDLAEGVLEAEGEASGEAAPRPALAGDVGGHAERDEVGQVAG